MFASRPLTSFVFELLIVYKMWIAILNYKNEKNTFAKCS